MVKHKCEQGKWEQHESFNYFVFFTVLIVSLLYLFIGTILLYSIFYERITTTECIGIIAATYIFLASFFIARDNGIIKWRWVRK